jgi:hypothetical protein
MRRFLRAASFALVLGTSIAALAEPTPQDIAQARDLGMQAQAAFDAGKLEESEKLWLAATGLFHAPTLTLGLARTQAKLGKLVLAQESYNKIIREQGDQPNLSPAFKDALDSARAEIGPISARIASVVIVVEGAPDPTVTIDDQPVSKAGLGLKRPVDPGSHVIRARAPGYKEAQTSFQVAETGVAEAKLRLERDPNAAPEPAETKPEQAALDTKSSSNTTLAIVAYGVGGAGLVFGAITGLLAAGKRSDLEGTCPNDKCPSSAQSDVDSYRTMGTLSTVGFIVAGVGAAAGTVLLLTAPKKTGASMTPYLSGSTAGLIGRF